MFQKNSAWHLLDPAKLPPPGWVLLTARALTGVADCVATAVSIIYISEVAETRLRCNNLRKLTTIMQSLNLLSVYPVTPDLIFFFNFFCLISYNSEIFLLFWISCHCPLTLLVRGSYLNSTALFSGLGIALAYLVNINVSKVIKLNICSRWGA